MLHGQEAAVAAWLHAQACLRHGLDVGEGLDPAAATAGCSAAVACSYGLMQRNASRVHSVQGGTLNRFQGGTPNSVQGGKVNSVLGGTVNRV